MPTSHIQLLETTVVNGISAGRPLPFFVVAYFLLQAAHKIALCRPKFIHL